MNINNNPGCPHLPRLARKQVQALGQQQYESLCCLCAKSVVGEDARVVVLADPIQVSLCLHCGAVLCEGGCLARHMHDGHWFWGRLLGDEHLPSLLGPQAESDSGGPTVSVYCRECGQIEARPLGQPAEEKQQEQAKKIGRFLDFIQLHIKNVIGVIMDSHRSRALTLNDPSLNLFGLRNLGNTCYINSVMQLLFYTNRFKQAYLSSPLPQYFINEDKQVKRDIELYYTEVLDRSEEDKWHQVVDKKTKMQLRDKFNQSHKFMPSAAVKDNKFNLVMSGFLKQVTQLVSSHSTEGQNQAAVYSPLEILLKLAEHDPKYSLKQEQDAEQTLITIIDMLSQGQFHALGQIAPDKKEKYNNVEKILGRQKLTPIQCLFGSYLASRVVCLGCERESWTLDFTYHLPIPLRHSKKVESESPACTEQPIKALKYYQQVRYPQQPPPKQPGLLDLLFCPQRLTQKENYYMCEKCSSLAAIKKFYLLSPPEVLLISLKRFEHSSHNKINAHVKFQPLLNLAPYALQGEQGERHSYQLYGVVVHQGDTISTGHYLCYARVQASEQGGQWVEFSDERYRRVTEKEVLAKQAYLLFYQRATEPS